MLHTGYISFITETEGGFDNDGNPVAPEREQSAFIPCNLALTSSTTKRYVPVVNGDAVLSSYQIYIEHNLLPELFDLDAVVEVELKDNNSLGLGTYRIQLKQNCSFVTKLKIVV